VTFVFWAFIAIGVLAVVLRVLAWLTGSEQLYEISWAFGAVTMMLGLVVFVIGGALLMGAFS
jgi:hypothetical protein